MSRASETFAESIADAENLLQHFNDLNTHPPAPQIEVLKRAGLVMAMTAWETYVEDRIAEACRERLKGLADVHLTGFVATRLEEELRRLNNPDSARTVKLFKDFAGVDLRKSWSWNNYDSKAVSERLNGYIKTRGEVVHRSRPLTQADGRHPVAGTLWQAPCGRHPVKKEELEKAIGFLKNLVQATERAFETADEPVSG